MVIRDVSEMTQMPLTFIFAKSFTHKLCWEILDGTNTGYMFVGSGGSVDPSCAYHCNAKSEDEWTALGCAVSGQPRATQRGDLGEGAPLNLTHSFHTKPLPKRRQRRRHHSSFSSSERTRSGGGAARDLLSHVPG